MAVDLVVAAVTAVAVASVLLLLGFFCVAALRALWDPVYCRFVGPASVLHSAPLLQVSAGVHVSEHVITSGQAHAYQRNLTKFSRMVIVSDDGKGTQAVETEGTQLCLINPCPLTSQVKGDLAGLGHVVLVVLTNCFHYMNIGDYITTYPSARFLAPAGLLHKRPELAVHCDVLPDPACGSFFPGTTYYRLPDFYQEHVVFVVRASLLYCSDTLIAQHAVDFNPSQTSLSWLQRAILWLSSRRYRDTIRFADYSRQYRRGTGALAANVACWQEILALPIQRVTTGHGVFRGFVPVTEADLDAVLHSIQRGDTAYDRVGAVVFRTCVLQWFPRYFHDWACLFTVEAQPRSAASSR